MTDKSDKDELNDIVKDLSALVDRLIVLVPTNGSIMVSFEDGQFKESFSSLVGSFETKLDYYKRQLKKVADKMPSNKKPRKPRSDAGKRRRGQNAK